MAGMTIGEVLAWLLAIDVVLYTGVGILRYLTWRTTCDILRVVKGQHDEAVTERGMDGKHRAGVPGSRKGLDMRRSSWPVMLKADGDISQATADRVRHGVSGRLRHGVSGGHRAVPEDECPRCVRDDDGEIHDVSGFDEMPCRHVTAEG